MMFEVVCSSVMSKLYRTVENLAVNLFCSELYVVSYLVRFTSIPMDILKDLRYMKISKLPVLF